MFFPLFTLGLALMLSYSTCQDVTNEECNSIIDLAFILDSSGSIRDNNPDDGSYDNWNLALRFIEDLVAKLPVSRDGTRIGFVQYANEGSVIFHLDTYSTQSQIQDAILNVKYLGGNTNTSGGLLVAAEQIFSPLYGDRSNVPNAAIVITDGKSTFDSDKTAQSAMVLKSAGVKIFVVGISDAVEVAEIAEISGPPHLENENYFVSADFQKLDALVEKVIAETCKPVIPVECENARVDLVFVLDSSGSIRDQNPSDKSYDNWALLLQFVVNVVNSLPIGATRVGVVKFSNIGENVFYLDSYNTKLDIIDAVKEIPYVGANTNTSGGIRVMRTQQFTLSKGDRSDAKNIAIVLTDGTSTFDKDLTIPEAELAQKAGIFMYSVGITKNINEAEIQGMSSDPKQLNSQYWVSTDFGTLTNIVNKVVEETCATAPALPPVASMVDLVFILDASNAVGAANWNKMLQFVVSLVERMQIGYGEIRIGLVRFSDTAQSMFYLNSYYDIASLRNAILNIGYIGSSTNTAAAIREMYYNQFNIAKGARTAMYNYAILITAGQSNVEYSVTSDALMAHKSGIRILSLGIGSSVSKYEISQISSEPKLEGVTYWVAEGFDSLDLYKEKLMAETYVTTPAPTVSPVASIVDLVFILDASNAVGAANWNKMLQFVVSLVERMQIGFGDIRIGLVRFSDTAQSMFYLNSYYDIASLRNAILNIGYIGSSTNTAAAIREMYYNQFNIAKGARTAMYNYAILITAGQSNVEYSVTSDALMAHKSGIRILSLGIGSSVSKYELSQISSEPKLEGVTYWVAEGFDSLDSYKEKLMAETYVTTPAPTVSPDCIGNIVDLVFVIDGSGSIRDTNPSDGSFDNWSLLLDFVATVISRLNIGYSQSRVGLVKYSQEVESKFYLNTYYDKSSLLQAVRNVEYMGSFTNTAGGIREMHYEQFTIGNGDRLDVSNLAVIITDGQSNINDQMTIKEAENARISGIRILTVGITNAIDEAELKGMSSMPQVEGETYWKSSDFTTLGYVIDAIVEETCSPQATQKPTLPPLTPAPGCSQSVADLVFVLDNSGSIRDNNPADRSYDNWSLLLQFVENIVNKLNIGPDATRVGVVSYSINAASIFYLNTYSTKSEVVDAVRFLQYIGSFTNTSGGIREMHYKQFSPYYGDRPNAMNIAIVITDGVSNVDKERTISDAVAAKNAGIKIYTVGITNGINEEEVRGISSAPQKEGVTYWRSVDFNKLDNIVDGIVSETCAIPGISGETGATGEIGASGRKGATGIPGRDGLHGATGRQGKTGSTGSKGPNGFQGVDGRDGSIGVAGVPGRDGQPGFPGSVGATGRQGIPGISIDGDTGATGRDGRTGGTGSIGQEGRSGFPGRVGAAGEQGRTGSTGSRGINGRPGFDGRTGGTGSIGAEGKTGSTGSTGLSGRDGLPGRIGFEGKTGSTGREGINGFQGRRGLTGEEGVTGSTGGRGFPGRDGNFGRQGLPGTDGRPGATGAKGFPGIDGRPGQIGLDGRTGSAGSTGLEGRPGLDGRTGATGEAGRTGATGLVGASGLKGLDGRPGLSGQRGEIGRTGATGKRGGDGLLGSTGDRGIEGRTGSTGSVGNIGSTGFEGRTGSTGRTADTGHTGRSGFHGDTGATGRMGASGLVGRIGATGDGRQGELGAAGSEGKTGATGTRGRSGKQGSTGAFGPAGARGLGGITGSTGASGPSGIDGFPGRIGTSGLPGRQGQTGNVGRDGRTGSTGAFGLDGRTGSTGSRGPFGRDGNPGQSGRTGSTGANGFPGKDGRTGSTGSIGREGRTGSTGSRGFDGRTGSTGSSGQKGPQGFKGIPGFNGLVGDVGVKGEPGRTGATGIRGFAGRDGSIGVDGRDGRTGATGSVGLEGRPGDIGMKGRDGLTGRPGSIGFSGRDGRTGATGDSGIDGKTGSTGREGRPGIKGFNGRRGVNGDLGRSGLDGRTGGTGADGLTGRSGLQGLAGVPGLEGRTGEKGQFGATGVRGERGFDGLIGAIGSDGRDGRTGATGSIGLSGRDGRTGGTGLAGLAGRDGQKGQEGITGATGNSGRDGIDGRTGATGSVGRAGATGSRGIDGRFGENGETGATGQKGLNGFDGRNGITGVSGSIGLSGREGAFGVLGRDGKTGATGAAGRDGRNGATGAIGRDGLSLQGDTGFAGQRGFSGDRGFDGKTGATGTAGLRGVAGDAGQRGRDGAIGTKGFGKAGATGAFGRNGVDGRIGLQGLAGVPGLDGQAGEIGFAGPAGEYCAVNECYENNGGCQQLCIDTYDSYHCACRPGYKQTIIPINCPGVINLCESSVLDLVFVIDSSGSIRKANPSDGSYDNWDLLLKFVTTIVDGLVIGRDQTRIGVVKFSNLGRSMFYLDDFTSKQDVKNAILSISFDDGNTNTSGGLKEMTQNQFILEHGDRPQVPNVAIVLTDGQSTFDSELTVPSAIAAHQKGIRIYSVGITDSIDENELRLISSSPQEKNKNYFTSANFVDLDSVREELLSQTCTQQTSDNLYCEKTILGDIQCFCRYNICSILPVNSTECTDENECLYQNGGCQQECINLVGSHRCECRRGYSLREDYRTCKDVNECLDNPCAPGLLCLNTYGSYVCKNEGGVSGIYQNEHPQSAAAGSHGVNVGTLVGASVLSALVAIIVAVVVVLVVRQAKKSGANKDLSDEDSFSSYGE